MTHVMPDTIDCIDQLFKTRSARSIFLARQLMYTKLPPSMFIEKYLYSNEGEAQDLSKFPMMKEIYDHLPQKLLLKCSRKTLKSTLLSNLICLNTIRWNYYKMLYLAPQEASTKYFSSNYVVPRFESPALKKTFVKGWEKNDVYEKIFADTHSSILFRYAKEDATRCRGPATDHNIMDECITSNSFIETYEGSKNILDVRIGDVIACVDEQHKLTYDTVKYIKSKGKRPTWRITLDNGKFLECTSNEKIFTNRGWIYLVQLLPKSEINRCKKAREIETSYSSTNSANIRNAFRRCSDATYNKIPEIQNITRHEADGICFTQGTNVTKLHQYTSTNLTKQRLWQGDLFFQYGDYSNIRIHTLDMLHQSRQPICENCQTRVVKPIDLGRAGLLVHGRWFFGKERKLSTFSYSRLSERASRVTCSISKNQRIKRKGTFNSKKHKNILYYSSETKGYLYLSSGNKTICNSVDALQMEHADVQLSILQYSDSTWQFQNLQKQEMSTNQKKQKQSKIRSKKQEKHRICNETEESLSNTQNEKGNIVSIEYIGEQEVYDIETSHYHNFFANGILVHNCQDMLFDILPIIYETMALSKYKREYFAGTPLTTDNTINELWKRSTQLEWATKCSGCSHWNMLTYDNNPLKMIREEGYSCSRCGKVLDTCQGEWVSAIANPNKIDLVGYHLAQPMLPYYNQTQKGWKEIYTKITDGKYGIHQIYNEVFGLAYDVGSKPITAEELKTLCILGPSRDQYSNFSILEKSKSNYVRYTTGVDWGVNQITSRTAVVHGGIRGDGIYEVFDAKIFDTLHYEDHINEIALVSNKVNSIVVADGGPDPIRAHMLGERTDPTRMLIVRYSNGKLVQYYDMPKGGPDWKSNRYVLHRSDCLSFTFRMLKGGKIRFPQWSEMEKCMEDILAEFIEVKEGGTRTKVGGLTQELMYSHAPNRPDDFLHALTFAIVAAYSSIGDPMLKGPSSSSTDIDAV